MSKRLRKKTFRVYLPKGRRYFLVVIYKTHLELRRGTSVGPRLRSHMACFQPGDVGPHLGSLCFSLLYLTDAAIVHEAVHAASDLLRVFWAVPKHKPKLGKPWPVVKAEEKFAQLVEYIYAETCKGLDRNLLRWRETWAE